jgi:hypothetical protein
LALATVSVACAKAAPEASSAADKAMSLSFMKNLLKVGSETVVKGLKSF